MTKALTASSGLMLAVEESVNERRLDTRFLDTFDYTYRAEFFLYNYAALASGSKQERAKAAIEYKQGYDDCLASIMIGDSPNKVVSLHYEAGWKDGTKTRNAEVSRRGFQDMYDFRTYVSKLQEKRKEEMEERERLNARAARKQRITNISFVLTIIVIVVGLVWGGVSWLTDVLAQAQPPEPEPVKESVLTAEAVKDYFNNMPASHLPFWFMLIPTIMVFIYLKLERVI